MANWYTADLHFGHKNVIRFCDRPFQSVVDMDATLIKNMTQRVGPEDDLWIRGDFAFGGGSKDRVYLEEVFDQLPGARQHLIVGNHDNQLVQSLGWSSVTYYAEVRDGPKKQRNTLFHYPMITWNHARGDALQFFGHIHNNWLGSRNSVNVGVDVWDFMPVTYDEIAQRAQTLPPNMHWDDVEPGSELV